jgi:hypothetical protein
MKKKILSIAMVTMVAVAAAWSYSSNNNDVALADLALSNVEALASGEGGGCSSACSSVGWGGSQIYRCTCDYTGMLSSCNRWGC